jgi:hypothetical protein
MVFVVESPARDDEGVGHVGHQYLCPSCLAETSSSTVTFSGALPHCLHVRDRSVDFGLPQIRFGHHPGYPTTISSDDNGLSTLNVIEKLGKVSLGL